MASQRKWHLRLFFFLPSLLKKKEAHEDLEDLSKQNRWDGLRQEQASNIHGTERSQWLELNEQGEE